MFKATLYRTGAVVTGWEAPPKPIGAKEGVRDIIEDMSPKSRRRCAFAFSNSPRDWGVMATLTFEKQPKDCKAGLAKFSRGIRREFGADLQWGWVMEFQSRGVVHFHVFFERLAFEARGWLHPAHVEIFRRKGKYVDILRGPAERFIVDLWCSASGEKSDRFVRFQRGGIVEILRSPEAAGRYVAKEASKRQQKRLPEGVDKAGRWWWLSPAGKPQPEKVIQLDPHRWPFPFATTTVFERSKMEEIEIESELALCQLKPNARQYRLNVSEPSSLNFSDMREVWERTTRTVEAKRNSESMKRLMRGLPLVPCPGPKP
jgi:hypothetical protein